MKRLLSISSIALLLALSSPGALNAEISAPDRVFESAATKNKLLNTPSSSVSKRRQITVPREAGSVFDGSSSGDNPIMAHDESPYFFNARKVLAQRELARVEDEINGKFYESNRTRRILESSA